WGVQSNIDDLASSLSVRKGDVGHMLFVAGREHVGVDQIDALLGGGSDEGSPELPYHSPRGVCHERQNLGNRVDREVVVEDLERLAGCDCSRDRELPDCGWAVEK